jgi:hypothetical protein
MPTGQPQSDAKTHVGALATQAAGNLVAMWNQLSMPKKISLVLLPIAFFFVLYGLSDNSASNAGPAHSASTKSSASKARTSAESSANPPPPTAAAPDSPATAATAKPETAPTPAPPPVAVPSPQKPTSRTPSPSASTSVASDQRRAVDQVAVGQYPSAATIYRDLAQKNPSNKAFREAARILSEHPPAQ